MSYRSTFQYNSSISKIFHYTSTTYFFVLAIHITILHIQNFPISVFFPAKGTCVNNAKVWEGNIDWTSPRRGVEPVKGSVAGTPHLTFLLELYYLLISTVIYKSTYMYMRPYYYFYQRNTDLQKNQLSLSESNYLYYSWIIKNSYIRNSHTDIVNSRNVLLYGNPKCKKIGYYYD